MFDNTQERKRAFLYYKNKELNKSKNWDFFKGLVHGFGQKVENFLFLLGKIGQENVFDDIVERKKSFLDY